MTNRESTGEQAENLPTSATQAPDADAVFPRVSDLGQLLLNWSWEGSEGVADKITRVAGVYDRETVSLVSAETAILYGDIYALAAIAGYAAYVLLLRTSVSLLFSLWLSIGIIFVLHLFAIVRKWSLPDFNLSQGSG